jgi:glycosyltransferase involved in cell wall biosynthesis
MFRTPRGKHLTIYNGIDVDAIESRRRGCGRLPGWENGVHVISVANFHPQKGYRTGLPVVADLCRSFPQLTYHVIGGSHGVNDVERWAHEFVAGQGLSDRIVLHGEQSDVVPFLTSADIFFSPSEKELMPVAFLEAMACRLPIVGTRTGGVPEILGQEGEWGVICDIGNAEQMRKRLACLIVNPELRSDLARRARVRVQDFSIPIIRNAYIDLYKDVLYN